MTGAEQRVSIRGLPEWLIRDYLADMGAAPVDRADSNPAMAGPGWSVRWTSRRAAIAGSGSLALTQFDFVFTGAGDAVAGAMRTFLAKTQRGGG